MNTTTLGNALVAKYADRTEFTPREVSEVAKELGYTGNEAYNFVTSQPKIRRGVYDLSAIVVPLDKTAPKTEKKAVSKALSSISTKDVYVPAKDNTYVSWGHSRDIETIIKSGKYFPTFISGLSGNGKTMMVEQGCAKLNREYIRVQINPLTDEDDLIGGFRLIEGETVFVKGPVIKAMEAGAILLLDEIDRGSNKLMCLQGILEGKPYLIKKTGQTIVPENGFNIIATANTKGRGSDDGRYISAVIMDDAFLERFPVTIAQPYPTVATERKILKNVMEKFNCLDEDFAELLCAWSDTIRKTYQDDGIEELITTRRLTHIVEAYSIWNDRKKAIEMCVNRFEDDVKESFIDLYQKVDASIGETPEAEVDAEETIDEILKGV